MTEVMRVAPEGDDRPLFNPAAWETALFKYGAVTRLTLRLYDRSGRLALGPVHPTPLHELLEGHGVDLFERCARRCLESTHSEGAPAMCTDHGLGVVGVRLRLGGEVVGAAVGGYALVDFVQMPALERLARSAGLGFARVWDVARREAPVPERRLKLNGELLQVLGDAILKENSRTRGFERSNLRLEEASNAKDEIMAVLSHELRSPLTPILAWAEILKADSDSAQTRRAADIIKRNVLLQTRLVDDLLDFNQATRGTLALELERQDVEEAVGSAVESVAEAAAEKGVRLEVAAVEAPLVVEADAGRLQQILVNILSNAIKFTPPEGRIDVTIARAGSQALVSVADTGEGITPEFLPHVFEIFRQQEQGMRRRHSGLGIGLALVRRLTEMHGGEVEVESEGEGRGTRVTLKLPLAAAASAAAAPAAGIRSTGPLLDVAILVAEDVDDAREVTRLMLQTLGARVTEARDGREALESVAAGRPDLVLCDLSMPRMDGFTFLRELRRKFGSTPPVVAVSGFAGEAERARTRAAGFEGHVCKPFDWDKLVTVVDGVLRRQS